MPPKPPVLVYRTDTERAALLAEPLDEQLLAEVRALFEPVKNLGHQEGLPENN